MGWNRVRRNTACFWMAVLLLGTGAASAVHAQQYGPQYYYPPHQPQPYYQTPPNAYPYAPPAPYGSSMPPAQYGYHPASQSMPIPQQYPRIYGPLTPLPQSAPQPREYIVPVPTPEAQPANMPVYEDAPPAQSFQTIPPSAGPAPSWPAKRSAQAPIMDLPASTAPAVEVPFHRPTNTETGWASVDYLVSVSKSLRPTAPLVTTSLVNVARLGSLGRPETAPMYGAEAIDFGLISGVRLNVGCYLGSDNRFSIEADGFLRGSSKPSFYATSDAAGYPVIARPIFNISNGANREASFLTSVPNKFSGSTDISTQSQLTGVEFNGRYHMYKWECVHADVLVGFRYLNLSESIRFTDRLSPLVGDQLTFRGAFIKSPNRISDEDLFGTSNQMYAGQIGGRVSWETGRFNMDAFTKLALGATVQHVNIDGSTTLITPTGNQVASGGVLAQNTNIGSHDRTVFAIVPEFGFNLGVQVVDHVRLRLGYSVLLWNNVARPTDQIDRNINTGQVPSSPNFGTATGPRSPSFQFGEDSFWNHFFNFGVEVRY